MKKIIFTLIAFIAIQLQAQIYKTNTGSIKFSSSTPLENIEATSKQAKAAVDSKTGKVQFSVKVNSFQFAKSLMQKHFQEKYLETKKYPTSDFSGTIANPTAVKWTTDGTYKVTVKGTLKMHGVSKEVSTPGEVVVKDGKPTLKASFSVKCEDYKIVIPDAVKDKIAKSVTIDINCPCT